MHTFEKIDVAAAVAWMCAVQMFKFYGVATYEGRKYTPALLHNS